jgi:hypothetical protein
MRRVCDKKCSAEIGTRHAFRVDDTKEDRDEDQEEDEKEEEETVQQSIVWTSFMLFDEKRRSCKPSTECFIATTPLPWRRSFRIVRRRKRDGDDCRNVTPTAPALA